MRFTTSTRSSRILGKRSARRSSVFTNYGDVEAGLIFMSEGVGGFFLARSTSAMTCAVICRPARANATAASLAGFVEKIATTCCAVVLLPIGTRKNARLPSRRTMPFTRRLTRSPSTCLEARVGVDRGLPQFSATFTPPQELGAPGVAKVDLSCAIA